MVKSIPDFIIIDDDVVNNLVCRRIIEIVYPEANIKTFTDPEEGLTYLKSEHVKEHAANTILFLDVNMPTLSGWEFLQTFEQGNSTIKEQLKIYMLSSSVNPLDKVRACSNKNVWDYIEKPLTTEVVEDTVARIREEERAAISREIHDELGQMLVRIKMDLIWLGTRIKDPDAEVLAKLRGAVGLVDDTVEAVRRINTEMRPRILDDLGLFAALEWQASEFARRSSIPCRLEITMDEPEFSKLVSIQIFRIFQEALTNISKHAGATQVEARLDYRQEKLVLTLTDNGVGAGPERLHNKSSFGLLGMRERAAVINGKIAFQTEPGQGMTVELTVPVII